MKKYLQIALVLIGVLAVSSCSSNDNNLAVDEEWKIANEEAFQAQRFDPEFQELKSQSNNGNILYKVLKKGTGEEPIYYTSTVQVYYKGTLIDGQVFDQRLFEDGSPATFAVKEVVDGWTTALQHMHVGDKWLVWIPQQLGYGRSGSSGGSVTIPPYSTLIFEMEVVKIVTE